MNTIFDEKLSPLVTVAIIPVSVAGVCNWASTVCFKCRSGEGFVLLIMLKETCRIWAAFGST